MRGGCVCPLRSARSWRAGAFWLRCWLLLLVRGRHDAGKLLKLGIYSEIAVALKGGPWREASMAMLARAFGLSKEEEEARAAGHDVLGGGNSARSFPRRSFTRMHSFFARVAEGGVHQMQRVSQRRGSEDDAGATISGVGPSAASVSAASVSAAASDPFEIEEGEGETRMSMSTPIGVSPARAREIVS
jgi:hypothetical protein